MKSTFADTSFYVAVTSPNDELHLRAVRLAQEFVGRIVTTEYVLVEVANLLSRGVDRELFLRLLAQVQADPQTRIIESSHELWVRGVGLFAGRPDKYWSLTDCISLVVMEELGLIEAMTADHHFEQAGYKALLK